MDLVPGQTLVYVPNDARHHKPTEVTVERVGRKWAYLAGNMGRVNDDLNMDGGGYSSPGRCYGSWSEYEETTVLHQTWNAFWQLIRDRHRIPEGVTLEGIAQARAALGL